MAGCDRKADRGGLCRAHYEQKRRAEAAGAVFVPKPPRTSPGQAGLEVHVRFDRELGQRVEASAKAAGVGPPEWLRTAAEEKLEKEKADG